MANASADKVFRKLNNFIIFVLRIKPLTNTANVNLRGGGLFEGSSQPLQPGDEIDSLAELLLLNGD
ncbi:hypothetical protein TERTU_1682 [Teredinibacter turnerae T7901]|uniref:Uncharacterized protein n=1 Tax=Teredinibacter turnerae (strain ATCC 39867 / T7901) TaxID=377629 RepID=C5BU25_TERTT|nr:hypothetical protein TERTU_1682 [Teredinibacter turnerae T7901]